MRSYKILFLLSTLVLFYGCKRKTTVKIKVWNYAIGAPISNANVVLIQRKTTGGIFSTNSECKEVASVITDNNGNCSFDRERLKTSESYNYFAVVNFAYGREKNYPCGGKTDGFIDVGRTSDQLIHYEDFPAYFKIEANNILNPSQAGDSIWVSLPTVKYSVPGEPFPFGGGGGISFVCKYGDGGYPYPPVFTSPIETTNAAGKLVLKVYKKKLGVVTQTIDTVVIQPYETKTIQINW